MIWTFKLIIGELRLTPLHTASIQDSPELLTKRRHQMLEAVELYLVHCLQQSSQLSGWKSLVLEPDDIGFRQIDETDSLVLAERHLHIGDFLELFVICWRKLFFFFQIHGVLLSRRPLRYQ